MGKIADMSVSTQDLAKSYLKLQLTINTTKDEQVKNPKYN